MPKMASLKRGGGGVGASDDRGGDSGRRERAETAAAAAGRAAGLVFRQGRSKRLHDNGSGRAGPANPDRRLAPNGRDLPVPNGV